MPASEDCGFDALGALIENFTPFDDPVSDGEFEGAFILLKRCDPSGFLAFIGAFDVFGALDIGAIDGAFERLRRPLGSDSVVIEVIDSPAVTNLGKVLD